MTPRRLLLNLLAGVAHGSGWTTLSRRRRRRRGDHRLFILEYHDLCGDEAQEREGVVSQQRLARHLAWLGQRFRMVTVAEGVHRLAEDGGNRDLLAVTFDDGYASNHTHGGPALRAAHCPATIYLATEFIDGSPLWFDVARHAFSALREYPGELPTPTRRTLERVLGRWPFGGGEVAALKYAPCDERLAVLDALQSLELATAPPRPAMTWQQIRDLQAAGIEMGAHTLTHPILSRQTAAQQEHELRGSRRRIHEATGVEPSTFAYPNGSADDFDAHTLRLVREIGFTACCTTVRGSNRPGADPWTLHRLGIGSDSIAVLACRLAGLFDQGMRRFLPSAARTAPDH